MFSQNKKLIIITPFIQLSSQNMSILANLHPVVPTHNVEKSITKQFALVCHLISEVHLVVDQNVLSVLNVLMTKLVQIRNVSILVPILVVKMPNVE
jgi:hypothetical protein